MISGCLGKYCNYSTNLMVLALTTFPIGLCLLFASREDWDFREKEWRMRSNVEKFHGWQKLAHNGGNDKGLYGDTCGGGTSTKSHKVL